MSRKDFEIFLYKNKLNEKSLIDVFPRLSSKTLKYIMNDLDSPTEQNTVYAFTDGGCKNNGKPNAKGGYAVFFTDNTDSEHFDLKTVGLIVCNPTNQKAELTAMYKLFGILQDNKALFINKKVVVCTDSMYSIKCINDWSKKWELNNWKTSKGEDVKNCDLIKTIVNLKKQCEDDKIQIVFKHVFSHITMPNDKTSKEYMLWYGNDRVDKMINELLEKNN
jgi:ribonuclease HI